MSPLHELVQVKNHFELLHSCCTPPAGGGICPKIMSHLLRPPAHMNELKQCCSFSFRVSAPPASPLLAMSDSDDDVPTLSAHTLAALQEFYNETRTDGNHATTPADQFAVGAVEEDWVS